MGREKQCKCLPERLISSSPANMNSHRTLDQIRKQPLRTHLFHSSERAWDNYLGIPTSSEHLLITAARPRISHPQLVAPYRRAPRKWSSCKAPGSCFLCWQWEDLPQDYNRLLSPRLKRLAGYLALSLSCPTDSEGPCSGRPGVDTTVFQSGHDKWN